MKSILNQIFDDVVEPYLAPRIKRGSIKAVKGYVSAVKVAREIALAAFGLGAVAGILVTGLILVVVGIIGLLPITTQAMLISLIVIGLAMLAVSGFLVYDGAKEKNWLEWTKANSLIAAVTSDWENSLIPPDPRAVMAGRTPDRGRDQARAAAQSYEDNRRVAAQNAVAMRPTFNAAAAEQP